MKANALETLVGAAVIAVAAIFFFFAYHGAGLGGPGGGYHVLAQFDNASGVNVGTDVRVAGIKVGTVVSQTLDPKSYQARVDMLLQPNVQLADDTSAKVTSEGLLGATFVALDPGGSDTKLVDGGEISYTQGAVDIWSLISQAMFSSKGSSKPADGAAPAAPAPAPDATAPAPAPDAPAPDAAPGKGDAPAAGQDNGQDSGTPPKQ
ncbi:outer membrane lipid asymmetry maintenance protein MlaD [Aestuariivirga litoralis]|uniref:outer membrane lipid asymmetry maintenance protein MlaD n=1 Tax=Aestuariivirga litoralis TaxID=2650924 RepID=UPI0018C78024|nr:outer membrane lipid asymmetry maintenance protein MlaD [Aestuariivirga litoralis]